MKAQRPEPRGRTRATPKWPGERVCQASVNRSSTLVCGGWKTTFSRAASFLVKRLGRVKLKRFYTFCVFLQKKAEWRAITARQSHGFSPSANATGSALLTKGISVWGGFVCFLCVDRLGSSICLLLFEN